MPRWSGIVGRLARRTFLREHEFHFGDDESILLRDSVTLRTKFYGDGGPLILTDRRLAFRARHSRFTGGKPSIDVPIGEIASVSVRRRKKGLLHVLDGDTFAIELRDGKIYEFETSFPDIWEQRINGIKAPNGYST